MAEKGRGRPKLRYSARWGRSMSPLINIDGPDRLVPFELDGVPQITPALIEASRSGRPLNGYHLRSFDAIIRRATAELRRRYEQHNEQALAALVAREADEALDDDF